MKIISIIGARPQFIKYSALTKEIRKSHKDILIHTGQHYDYNMNKVFFDEMGIPEPDYNLGIGSGTHGHQTGKMLTQIEDILTHEHPDLVMVYGDTNSTLAGALAAVKMHIKIAHVEAGLRSFDKSMPEEINRILTDHCSDLLFCPTQTAVNNLKQEGLSTGVYLTGDVMVDALNNNKDIAEHSTILDSLKLTAKHYIVVTIHRASNTDNEENLKTISQCLIELSKHGTTIVFPLHPRTAKLLKNYGLYDEIKRRIKIIDPLGYFDFLKLMRYAEKILTDSGGIQKESYILKVPCITLRENTEWIETIEDGWNVLAGTNANKIVRMAREFDTPQNYSALFGTGACSKITDIIQNIADRLI
jgi:UDP-N-acetylglucosamine 2-epimerase